MAVTSYDNANLNATQIAGIQQATQAWNTAHANNDTQGMANAHALAESIRNGAGYTSDSSGNFNGALNTISGSIPSLDEFLSQVRGISAENTAKSQELAQLQWNFNKEEAQKNRDWQEYMSNTAHQREVQDLLKAGLNPILSAGGNGASVTSGATASGSSGSVDTSANSVVGSFLSSLINSATAINTANINAKNSLALANINGQYSTNIAGINASALKYGYDEATRRMIQELGISKENEEYFLKNYPSSLQRLMAQNIQEMKSQPGLFSWLMNLLN